MPQSDDSVSTGELARLIQKIDRRLDGMEARFVALAAYEADRRSNEETHKRLADTIRDVEIRMLDALREQGARQSEATRSLEARADDEEKRKASNRFQVGLAIFASALSFVVALIVGVMSMRGG